MRILRASGTRVLSVFAAFAGISALPGIPAIAGGGGGGGAAGEPQARLVARSVLPARSFRTGSPPSGAFLTAEERAVAAGNGLSGPAAGPYFPRQPVQGFSSMVPAVDGNWWALADNGYAWRGNSADWQLVLYRLDPQWGSPAGPRLIEAILLRDPDRRIPWTIVCDPGSGIRLPDLSFNALPLPPAACGDDLEARLLTGFDFDPESFVLASDGSFWISEEFGPFLLHFAADGLLVEPPVAVPGVRSPQNPFLDFTRRAHPEAPTIAASRGFEGMAISPDGDTLFALLEGAVTGDDAQDLRIYVYRIAARRFEKSHLRVRLEAASQTVDLTKLEYPGGARLFPDAAAPASGPVAIGELKAVNDHELLMIERDNLGDDERAPRFKKVFLLDTQGAAERGGHVGKTLLLDLLALPDPDAVGGDGDFFRLPFYTIESVHLVDERTLLVASDNNLPFSNGRARGGSSDRRGPLASDETELVLVRLGTPLRADPRLLPRASQTVGK
ncbi:MAG: esterase-like activity of phytase family protein [Thermoanaerobaculia bacterium]|nr:esterase-like activity of phytase family protein [Thermoanaerobaculia bacterium]MBP9824107.1 esterase-like activity of phytase family protein [Thermoanaerobaculia bacterium]